MPQSVLFSPFSLERLKDSREDTPTTRSDTLELARSFATYTKSSYVELLEFGDIHLDVEISDVLSDGMKCNSCYVRFLKFYDASCTDLSPLSVAKSLRGVTKMQLVYGKACLMTKQRRCPRSLSTVTKGASRKYV